MKNTDGEEIVKLQTQVSELQGDITEIKSDIKMILSNIAATTTQNVILNREVENLRTEIIALKKKEGLWAWLKPTLAAVGGAILTILVTNYIQHVGK